MLQDHNIKTFLEQTASGSPVPGGGSIAALSAALGAALSEMVANLTIGKKGYESSEEEMKIIAEKASVLREKLARDIDRDADAYNEVMQAFKLPKGNEEEKAERKKAIQEGLKTAALVPLDVAKDAAIIMDMAEKVVRDGNKNAVTDGVVAAMMSRTAALAAICNVKVNLKEIEDKGFVKDISAKTEQTENEIRKKEKEIRFAAQI
ncbi:cyclodeaminase/cyclohydrolase family protein [Desulfococcaceae bacterium HSG8]|nr:cyclodeaminase/cyclohydrolase family protein [Desulfococcaceae bacterium HSG8]